MTQNLHVLVVEDEAATRDRLVRALAEVPTVRLQGAVGTFAEAVAAIEKAPPDILLTDLGLPDGYGDALVARLLERRPDARALVITVFSDEATVIRALEAGASGYLLKDANVAHIGDSLRQLIDGGAPISPSIARYLLKRFRKPSEPPTELAAPIPSGEEDLLTPREQEVLKLTAKGFRFRECAELLKISPHTVSTHVRKIYRKLAVQSRSEAVYEARLRGILGAND